MNVFQGIQAPKVLYEVDSAYNGHIKVVEVGSTRKIKVDDFEQSISYTSPNCERLVWGKVVKVLKDYHPDVKNVMILGMGGATMAHLISKNFQNPFILSVELDPVMVDIAAKYFDLDKIPNHRIVVDDAMRVVVEPEKYNLEPSMFDALVVDIYVGEKYQDLGKSGNFLTAVKNMVKPGGILIFNRMYLTHHQDEVNTFVDYVSDYLGEVKCLVVAGYTNSDNLLIFGRV